MKSSAPLLQLPVDEDLYLRRATAADAQDLYFIIDRDRPYLREWLPFIDFTQDPSDTEAYLKFVSASNNTSDLVFVIVHEREVCGLIGYKRIDRLNKKLEIGYWLAEHKQGKGIMRRSCQTLLAYAFEKLRMNRIEIRVGVDNQRSSNIPRQLGFTLEGVERDGEFLNDHYHDLEVYSLLRSEYEG